MNKLNIQNIITINTLILCMLLSPNANANATEYYGQGLNNWVTNNTQVTGFNGTITSSDIQNQDDSFFGGYDNPRVIGEVYNNTVTFESGTLNTVGAAGTNGPAYVHNNTLNITGGIGTNAYGGYSYAGTVSNNTVNISGGTITNIYGGYIGNYKYSSGSASNNTINISDGTATTIYGGYTENGSTSNNTIVINNLAITGDEPTIYGGYQAQNSSNNSEANENIIYLNGNITSVIPDTNLLILTARAYNAHNNTLVIGKNASFDTNITLAGFFSTPLYEASGSNNSLEIWTKDISVNNIQNFDHLYFILPNTIQNGDTILSLSNSINIENVTIGVATQSGTNLDIGNKITLIDKTDGGNFFQTDMNTISLSGGSFTTDYTFGLSIDEDNNNALMATVTGKNVNDEIKAPAEGQISSMALLNASTDLIINTSLENAVKSAKQSPNNTATFGSISSGYSKYKTGSHVNLNNISLLTGIAKNITNNTLLGLFAEAGYGNYSTHNYFNSGNVRGNGDSQYYGLGLIGHYDFTKNIYTEFSGHTGYIHNYWESNDTKVPVNYDTDALYYGAHFGIGYDVAINKSFELDTYTKYLYTHQNGDNTEIDGTRFDFENINSHLLRLGTQLFYNISDNIKPFIGGAWEHEFYGLAKSSTETIIIDTPSLRGDTGMFEIGIKTNNTSESAWNLDVSIQGFIGKRYGFNGLIKAKYIF